MNTSTMVNMRITEEGMAEKELEPDNLAVVSV